MKRTTKANTPRDVEDYLARVPPIQRKALEQLRRTIKSVVPDAVEVISYQIPTFKLNGRMLVSYAAFSEHCSFFPGAGPTETHKDELKFFRNFKRHSSLHSGEASIGGFGEEIGQDQNQVERGRAKETEN